MRNPFVSDSNFTNRMVFIPVVVLAVWLFNSYQLGKFSKYNKHYKLWIIGAALLTLTVMVFVVWYRFGYKQ